MDEICRPANEINVVECQFVGLVYQKCLPVNEIDEVECQSVGPSCQIGLLICQSVGPDSESDGPVCQLAGLVCQFVGVMDESEDVFMIPGEYRIQDGQIELNQGRRTLQVLVANEGDRPIQVGSHFPFFEVNRALRFDRESAFNMRLDIPAGTAVRFEPGESRPVDLVELGGTKQAFGLNNLSQGEEMGPQVLARLSEWQQLRGESR